MSPEMLQGDHSHGREVDIYSLGILLYEMLTGSPPFSGEGIERHILNRRIIKGDVKYPSYLSVEVVDLIEKLLHTPRPTLEEVKGHPFLSGLLDPRAKPFNKDWHSNVNLLLSIQPPIIPSPSSRSLNFDGETLSLPVRLTFESDLYPPK